MLKKLLLLIVILFGINSAFAQYGWTKAQVFLKTGEVKSGEAFLPLQPYNAITISSNEMVKFRTAKKAKKEKFKPNQVDSILFNVNDRIDKYITTYITKKKKRLAFVHLIMEGNVSLIGRTEKTNMQTSRHNDVDPWDIEKPALSNYFNHNRLLLIKDGKVLEQIKIKGFRKRAMEFFSECEKLVKKIDNKELKKEDLIEITEFYNTNCN